MCSRARFRRGCRSARRKLQHFHKQWNGKATRDEEQHLAFDVSVPASFWDQLWGRQAAVSVSIRLDRVFPLTPTPIQVSLTANATGSQRPRSIQLLEQVGPAILEALRQVLMVNAEKRTQERFLWTSDVTVIPLDPDGRKQDAVVCRGKDISPSGMGIYLPHDLNTVTVLLELPQIETGRTVCVAGTLVRAKCSADGCRRDAAVICLFELSADLRGSTQIQSRGAGSSLHGAMHFSPQSPQSTQRQDWSNPRRTNRQ